MASLCVGWRHRSEGGAVRSRFTVRERGGRSRFSPGVLLKCQKALEDLQTAVLNLVRVETGTATGARFSGLEWLRFYFGRLTIERAVLK